MQREEGLVSERADRLPLRSARSALTPGPQLWVVSRVTPAICALCFLIHPEGPGPAARGCSEMTCAWEPSSAL